jgi:hypothetical protein
MQPGRKWQRRSTCLRLPSLNRCVDLNVLSPVTFAGSIAAMTCQVDCEQVNVSRRDIHTRVILMLSYPVALTTNLWLLEVPCGSALMGGQWPLSTLVRCCCLRLTRLTPKQLTQRSSRQRLHSSCAGSPPVSRYPCVAMPLWRLLLSSSLVSGRIAH